MGQKRKRSERAESIELYAAKGQGRKGTNKRYTLRSDLWELRPPADGKFAELVSATRTARMVEAAPELTELLRTLVELGGPCEVPEHRCRWQLAVNRASELLTHFD